MNEKVIGIYDGMVLYGNSWAMFQKRQGGRVVGFEFGYHCVGGSKLVESEVL